MKLDVRRGASALWRGSVALVRTALRHDILQLAAALTFFTVLSVVPALMVIISLLGVIGIPPETLESIVDSVAERTQSEEVVKWVNIALDNVFQSASAEAFLSVGVLTALWSASAYIRSFMWSSDRIYEVTTRRSYWRRGLPIRLGLALLLIVLFTVAVAVVALLGPLRDWVAGALGVEEGGATWFTLTGPLLLGTTVVMLALLFKYTPHRDQPSLWRLVAGAGVTVVAWFLASAGFSIYFVYFSSYNRVYGAIGSVLGALVWAWIMNIAILAGVEINRAIEQWGGDESAEQAAAADPAVAADAADATE